jgi:hypothetical protein
LSLTDRKSERNAGVRYRHLPDFLKEVEAWIIINRQGRLNQHSRETRSQRLKSGKMSQSNQRQSFSYHGSMIGQDLDSDGEGDGRGGKGRDGDKGDKKGIINRVNRKLSLV